MNLCGNVLEVHPPLVALLERPVHLLIRFCVETPCDPFRQDVIKDMDARVVLWEVPVL